MVHLDNVDLEVISDHSRVMELGLVDGSEIAVNYQMSFAHKAYQAYGPGGACGSSAVD